MDISIFTDKNKIPDDAMLAAALGKTCALWKELEKYVCGKYPAAVKEWKMTGAKYGWSYRLNDKKRVIIYLLPRDKFFKAAFVFGNKAFEEIMKSGISENIKKELESAKVYAEGRGIRIDVKNKPALKDIYKLIDIKLAN
jgi:hypothetical protein